MTHLLLTGAGFTKNWGGLIAKEFFSRLLSANLDAFTRDLLFKTRSFEDVMSTLQATAVSQRTTEAKKRLDDFTSEILGIFNGMNNLLLRGQFEFNNNLAYQLRPFLERFDAIFTLNQDTLIEAQYIPGFVGGRWSGAVMPGTKRLGPVPHIQGAIEDRIAALTPDMDTLRYEPRFQPYIKLHGSSNWRVDSQGGPLLILGGKKAQAIKLHPLLTRYLEIFEEQLVRPETHLMIIGYGFNDEHINEVIARGVEKGLKTFIIDPRGIDAFDKVDHSMVVGRSPHPFTELMKTSVVGESAKPLTDTFGQDRGEHAYVSNFFRK